MRKHILLFLTIAFCWIFLIPLWSTCYGEDYNDLTSDEKAIIEWINQLRIKEGIPELKMDTLLKHAAKEHSQDMATKNILDDGPPIYKTPFERLNKKRISDINNLVVVAKADSVEALKVLIKSDTTAMIKLLSKDMTHIGVGIVISEDHIWLTAHMVERVITFKNFMLETKSGVVPQKSITIQGFTPKEMIKACMTFEENLEAYNYERIEIVTPDSEGNFVLHFDFNLGNGTYGFLFWVYENGQYRKSNYFDIIVK